MIRMQEHYYLTKPIEALESSYCSFLNDWEKSKEKMVPWVLERDPTHFKEMIGLFEEEARGENIPKNWVPASTFWYCSSENELIGVVNIRHYLTEELLQTGGHIGYGIKPSMRRKGHATRLLNLSLEECQKLGLKKMLITCDKENEGSRKTIQHNGGQMENEVVENNGNIVQRYWISLP